MPIKFLKHFIWIGTIGFYGLGLHIFKGSTYKLSRKMPNIHIIQKAETILIHSYKIIFYCGDR